MLKALNRNKLIINQINPLKYIKLDRIPCYLNNRVSTFASTKTLTSLNLTSTKIKEINSLIQINNDTQQLIVEGKAFSYRYLRDHCQCPLCRQPSTLQKLHTPGYITNSLKILQVKQDSENKLHITWDKNSIIGQTDIHDGFCNLDSLQLDSIDPIRKNLDWKPWVISPSSFDPIPYDSILSDSKENWEALKKLYEYGLIIIDNVPKAEDSIIQLSNKMAPLLDTFYGRTWRVESKKQAENIAYTNVSLDLHMDLLYFEQPPGIQLLHSLTNQVQGGASHFLDSYSLLLSYQQEFPNYYEALKTLPLNFFYHNDGHYLFHQHTMISKSTMFPNKPILNYSPPFMAPPSLSGQKLEEYYQLWQHFEEFIKLKRSKSNFEVIFKLEEGRCAIFNNRRILHGREAFDATQGARCFIGGYMHWDAILDKIRVGLELYQDNP